MRLIHRLLKLEEKQQQATATCYPLAFFYGKACKPEPLIRNQTLVAFYNQFNKEVLHD